MIEIHHSADARLASEIAFDYDDDHHHHHRNMRAWMFGVKAFDPATELSHGLGATFNTAMQVGPKTVRSVVQIIEWEKNSLITLDSIEGFRNATRLTVDFRYQLPGGRG